jgi:type II secretory pathway pseudopilin PulG
MEVLIVSLALLIVIAAFLASRFISPGNPFPFSKKNSLFTQVERTYLNMLEQAVKGQYKVINRVKMADILELKNNVDTKSRIAAAVKLNAKYLDFVLCDPTDMSIVAVVDLVNNNSKDGHKAVPDWFVSGAFEAAGIPYVRMKIKTGYTITDIQQGLAAKIGPNSIKPEPLLKGTVKKSPTRPIRPLEPVVQTPALPNIVPEPRIRSQSTAMIH